jgi:hypothetical protein
MQGEAMRHGIAGMISTCSWSLLVGDLHGSTLSELYSTPERMEGGAKTILLLRDGFRQQM